MRYVFLCLLSLAGCATTPTPTSAIDTAAQLNNAALNAAIALGTAGAIGSKDLQNVENITNAVDGLLKTAEAAVVAGQSGSATATLTAVTTTLSQLAICLADKGEPAIAACLAGVPQP